MLKHFVVILVLVVAISTVAYAKSETYEVDNAHSAIMFEAGHLGISRAFGRFNEFSGTVIMDKDTPSNSSVTITIDPASVDTNSADRDTHLRGPDFFNTKQFSKWTFKSDSVKAGKNGLYTISGDLTAHGRTNVVTLSIRLVGEGNDPWGGYRAGWIGELTFDRSDFGMDYMVDGLGDEVILTISLEGIRK